MAFHVDEMGHGRMRVRRIRVGLLLFPGQAPPPINRRDPDPPVTRSQLSTIGMRMTFQAGSIWQPFAVEDGGYLIEYTFVFEIRMCEGATPVPAITVASGGYTEITSDQEQTRGHHSAYQEAVTQGIDNIAVVYPYFAGLGGEAVAMYLHPNGRFEAPTASARGLMTCASNLIWIGLNGMDPADPRVSQTAAHEMGHLLGLDDRPPDGGIMGRRRFDPDVRYVRRSLTDRDKALVHLAVESRVRGSSIAHHAVQLPSPPPGSTRRPRVRPR